MDLSIVIVSWNISGLLRQCLESVYAHPPECLFEVVVVDNSSDDDSVPMVQKRYPGVRLFTNRDNAGFARATNQGIRATLGRYALLLITGAIVQLGALSTMVGFVAAHSQGALTATSPRRNQEAFTNSLVL